MIRLNKNQELTLKMKELQTQITTLKTQLEEAHKANQNKSRSEAKLEDQKRDYEATIENLEKSNYHLNPLF
jgi:chromosome segregation ATPase